MKRLLLAVMLLLASLAAANAASRVLILYDQGADKRQPALTDARYLANLLGHFKTSVRLVPMAEYKPGGMDKSDAIFYITYEKKFALPENFKADFYKNTKTFCWLNHQLGELDQQFLKNRFGFHFKEYREDLGFNTVVYRQAAFPKGDDNVNIMTIDNPSQVQIIASVSNAKGMSVPYIIRSRNLYVVADSPFSYASEKDRYLAFADLLHDIIGENHPTGHTALIRIEDINPSTDPAALLRIAKYLKSKNVPFAVSLVPVFVDPTEKTEYRLEDRPKLLSVLQKIPSYGGTFILHGYTHQYHGVTTDDYEFWDDIADKPIRGDSVENESQRIEKGLKECTSNGIYPLLWETPHYFASRNTYLAVKKYFSHVFERRGTMDHLGTDQFFPYPVRDMYGQAVIPENLGYLTVDKPNPQELLDTARLDLAVRDGCASFFFHPFIDISHLKKLVTGLRAMGYEFADVRSFSPNVIARDKAMLCGGANVRIEASERYIAVKTFDWQGKEKSRKIVDNSEHVPYSTELQPAAGTYAVITPQDELEPGLLKKIWRLAKTDVSYMRRLKGDEKPGGKLSEVMRVAFVLPDRMSVAGEERNDLASLRFSLSVAGVPCIELKAKELDNADLREFDIIVLPYASAKNLDTDAVAHVKEAVNSGSNIVFEGATRLNDAFGIELQEEAVKVRRVRDYQFPDIPLYWPKEAEIRPVYQPQDNNYRILCVEEESNAPLVVSGTFGKGSFLYLATYFDPHTDRGYSRFPFLLEMLNTAFRYAPLAERRTAEVYFDPGTRQFISIEKLAKLWRKYGVHAVYAGGWHFYDKYTYDYDRLIRVCHKNGILVYCWLEPPMVNQKFWNKYPRWREKTATGKDAMVAWRYLMNMADPACRAKAFAETETLLTKYDWDGVNLAELYFDSAGGPASPASFTPMNMTVRREFQKLGGFDPVELFDPRSAHYWQTNTADWQKFIAYRTELCTKLKIQYLDFLSGIRKKKKDFEIVMTVIDTWLTPQLADYIAEDMPKILQMQKKYDITLQVEDPVHQWSAQPERYEKLGAYYRQFVKDPARLALDCNVLDNHKKGEGGLPAEKPTGEEIRQIAYNMSAADCRPVFYSEQTLFENDFRNITAALAHDTVVVPDGEMQWKVNTPTMVSLRTGKKDLLVKLDDRIWFAGEGDNVIVPAGDHVLRFEPEPRYFDMASLKPRLHFISGELAAATFLNDAIELSYDSGSTPCYAIVNKRPGKITIDGIKTACPFEEADGAFVIKLPGGTHEAVISVGGGFTHLVETSGVILFSIVIIFGFVTSVLFLGLFVVIKIKRKLAL